MRLLRCTRNDKPTVIPVNAGSQAVDGFRLTACRHDPVVDAITPYAWMITSKSLRATLWRGNLSLVFFMLLFFTVHANAANGDYQRGLQAYQQQNYEKAYKLWQPLAEQGEAVAQYRLGSLYELGNGVERDLAIAREWYRWAAEQGLMDAEYALGNWYQQRWHSGIRHGQDFQSNEVDRKHALYWYRRAAERGHEQASGAISRLLQQNNEPGLIDGREWMAIILLAGIIALLVFTAYRLLSGHRGPKSIAPDQDPEAVRRFEHIYNQALHGDKQAQYFLGVMYSSGDGVTEDDEQALHWYKRAAERDYAPAQRAVGLCYANARGVSRDQPQSVTWLRRAAENGDGEAQYELGMKYMSGEGVSEDFQQTLFWMKKAARKGIGEAQLELGILLRDGAGVDHVSGPFASYRNGSVINKDAEEALRWLIRAAEQGLVDAQVNVADMYHRGEGIPVDEHRAVYWFREAAQNGNEYAINKLSRIVSEAEQRA